MSNTLSDSTTVPPITCPDWCTINHDLVAGDGHDGPSWPEIPSVRGGGLHAVQISAGDWFGHVVVYLDAGHLALTPERARTAGLALLSAASWAKDHQVTA